MNEPHLGILAALAMALVAGCDERDDVRVASSPELAVVPVSTPSGTAPAASPSGSIQPAASPLPASYGPAAGTVRVVFAGDIALSLATGSLIERRLAGDPHLPRHIGPEFPFADVASVLRDADVTIGNLECVWSQRGEVDTWHTPFRCTATTAEVLLAAGFDMVSVANNHSMDYGDEGFADMLAKLDAAGLPHGGAANMRREAQRPWIATVRGLRIGVLSYYHLPEPPYADVERASSQVDVLIAFMHWGREGDPKPLMLQRDVAHGLIDAGVHLVVGTHAHVVQETEWYRGRLIHYGLGNFIFSGMTHDELHRTGELLEVDLDADSLTARSYTVRLDQDGAPHLRGAPKTLTME